MTKYLKKQIEELERLSGAKSLPYLDMAMDEYEMSFENGYRSGLEEAAKLGLSIIEEIRLDFHNYVSDSNSKIMELRMELEKLKEIK